MNIHVLGEELYTQNMSVLCSFQYHICCSGVLMKLPFFSLFFSFTLFSDYSMAILFKLFPIVMGEQFYINAQNDESIQSPLVPSRIPKSLKMSILFNYEFKLGIFLPCIIN